MRHAQWIEWTRTSLQPREREDVLTALTSEQNAHLLERDYVWVEGVGVLWNPPDGDLLRRARFTHGTHFQTQRGEFYIDSEGSARELSVSPTRPSRAFGAPTESSREYGEVRRLRGLRRSPQRGPASGRRVDPGE